MSLPLHTHPDPMHVAAIPPCAPPAPEQGATVGHALLQALAGFAVVIVPGLDGSGPHHWQSRWELFLRLHGVTVHRVQQENWTRPTYHDWKAQLQRTVRACRQPVILVAHSLGAILSVRMASEQGADGVVAAFLVAPADIDHHHGPDSGRVADFAPLPATPLPFPAMLLASQDDEWLSMSRARVLATQWRATLVDAGMVGHIGNHAHVGLWPAGMQALDDLARSVRLRAMADAMPSLS
ncbi:RBBP9/YdeN family alpha/beta hydrolase [Komagataeibacter swingsii]|uniref:Alpha/beta hydrolase n=1 Tax=Komagataeibacter swingsii TaxID=215220 RepID=A0A850P414_9PROT|nr:alpha/beta hydrolase [Komagataeibacter swingsii]NVN37370.1 alpha/beta hydrolase [Komagataeibacter swingsii]